jgi:hypothetical protein
MRTIFLLCVLFFISVSKAWPANGERLSFCYESWRPFIYTNNLGEAVGLHIDVIKQVLEPFNYQLFFIELPYLRCLKKVQIGKIDFVLHVDETDDILLIDHPIGSWDLLLAYQAKSQNELLTEENKKLDKVVIARDYNYPQAVLDTLYENSGQILKRSYYIRTRQEVKNLFTLLENGFVDAILVDKSWVTNEMSRQPLGITLSEKILFSQPQYIGYIEQNSAVAEKILQALTAHTNQ